MTCKDMVLNDRQTESQDKGILGKLWAKKNLILKNKDS
jgi:hypothetical protein